MFGEEVARHSNAQPAAEQPGGADKPSGGFSFDEFFAGGKTGAEGAAAGAAAGGTPTPSDSARTPGRSSGRTQRPAEDEAEADQFQQWLKKLKS